MIEAQVLMTVSDFLNFFPRNNFLEEGFAVQWGEGGGGVVFQIGGASFLNGWHHIGGIGFDGRFSKKL